MQPNGTTGLPPIEYPTVTVGGRKYIVKYSQLAEYLVSKWGYQMSDLLQILNTEYNSDPRRLSFIFQLFAACTGHNFTNAVPRQDPLTAEQWMEILPEDDPEVMGNIGKAVVLALVKRLSERRAKAGPTPTVTAETTDRPM